MGHASKDSKTSPQEAAKGGPKDSLKMENPGSPKLDSMTHVQIPAASGY